MIHAMMSEAGSGGRERSHVVSTFGALAADQQRAEAEARRVLAETEPERTVRVSELRDDGEGCWSREYRTRIMAESVALDNMLCVRYCHESEALAEALAAFVGASDPAEYLARRAQAAKVRESILRVAAGFESHA